MQYNYRRTIKKLVSLFASLALGVTVFVGLPTSAQAEYLVKEATVVDVENTSSNGDNFAILVQGGEGPCMDKYIIFPKSGIKNADVYQRGYLGALTALEKNDKLKVNVYDYTGHSCRNGGQLVVTSRK